MVYKINVKERLYQKNKSTEIDLQNKPDVKDVKDVKDVHKNIKNRLIGESRG